MVAPKKAVAKKEIEAPKEAVAQNETAFKPEELSGKALNAFNKLNSGYTTYNRVDKILESIFNIMKEFVPDFLHVEVGKNNDLRRLLYKFPNKPFVNYYIDFIVDPSGGENLWDLEGNIIYGIYINNKIDQEKEKSCAICKGTVFCNCINEKPFLKLNLDENGLIESVDKIDDNWIVTINQEGKVESNKLNIKTIREIHYRALEYIFIDALYFLNEKYKNF